VPEGLRLLGCREPASLTAAQDIAECLRTPGMSTEAAMPPLPPASPSGRSRHDGRPSGGSVVSTLPSSTKASRAGSEVSGVDAALAPHDRSVDGATPRSAPASVISNGRNRSRATSQVSQALSKTLIL
jgi:hypothetical protein